MTPDRSRSDTVGRVANKVRVEGGFAHSTLTSTFGNITLLTHFLRQRFKKKNKVLERIRKSKNLITEKLLEGLDAKVF